MTVMNSLLSFALRAGSAAAISFSALTLLYSGSEYAAIGSVSVSVDMLLKAVPTIAAVVYPLLVQKWPSLAGLATLVFNIIKYRSPETASMLSKLSALEVYAQQQGCAKMQGDCERLRSAILGKDAPAKSEAK